MPKARGSLSEVRVQGRLPPPPVPCPSSPARRRQRTSVMSGAIKGDPRRSARPARIHRRPRQRGPTAPRRRSAARRRPLGVADAHPSARTPRCGKKVGLTPPDNVQPRRPSAVPAGRRNRRDPARQSGANSRRPPPAPPQATSAQTRNIPTATSPPLPVFAILSAKPGGLCTLFAASQAVLEKRHGALPPFAPARNALSWRHAMSQNPPALRPDLARASIPRPPPAPDSRGSGGLRWACPKALVDRSAS